MSVDDCLEDQPGFQSSHSWRDCGRGFETTGREKPRLGLGTLRVREWMGGAHLRRIKMRRSKLLISFTENCHQVIHGAIDLEGKAIPDLFAFSHSRIALSHLSDSSIPPSFPPHFNRCAQISPLQQEFYDPVRCHVHQPPHKTASGVCVTLDLGSFGEGEQASSFFAAIPGQVVISATVLMSYSIVR
jgi:hypothetical protein